jgi:hypothetical protein
LLEEFLVHLCIFSYICSKEYGSIECQSRNCGPNSNIKYWFKNKGSNHSSRTLEVLKKIWMELTYNHRSLGQKKEFQSSKCE